MDNLRIYFDLCALKMPFDDQSSPRIRLESEAVLMIMQSKRDGIEFIHTQAQDLENDQNPLGWRAERVRRWLEMLPVVSLPVQELAARIEALVGLGFKPFDALQLGSAELAGASVFCTCDDRLLKNADRQTQNLKLRVVDPVELARELTHD